MFHRFRIGTMDAAMVSDGPLLLPRAARVFPDADRAALNAALAAAGQTSGKLRVAQNCLLLHTGGKRVLFDNGMGSSTLFGPESGRLLDGLAEASIDPGSIDALVLTHAHSDHCWGTMADDGTPNFPNATVYLAQAELDFWLSDPAGKGTEVTLAGVRKHLLPVRDRMHLLRDGEAFLPGVQAWLTPGHTPGHLAFLFDGGWCLTGDVAFHDPLSYRFTDSKCLFDEDPAEGVVTRRQLLDRLTNEKLRVIGYHHPWPGLGHVERTGELYRFVADH